MRSGIAVTESSMFLEFLLELPTFSRTVMSERLVSMVSRPTLRAGDEAEDVISSRLKSAVRVLPG